MSILEGWACTVHNEPWPRWREKDAPFFERETDSFRQVHFVWDLLEGCHYQPQIGSGAPDGARC